MAGGACSCTGESGPGTCHRLPTAFAISHSIALCLLPPHGPKIILPYVLACECTYAAQFRKASGLLSLIGSHVTVPTTRDGRGAFCFSEDSSIH